MYCFNSDEVESCKEIVKFKGVKFKFRAELKTCQWILLPQCFTMESNLYKKKSPLKFNVSQNVCMHCFNSDQVESFKEIVKL